MKFQVSSRSAIVYFVATFITVVQAAGQLPSTTCYAPNGNASEISYYSGGLEVGPLYMCPPGADGYATCCHEGDYCHPDNLCYNAGGGTPVVWRQYCTDKTWNSPNCSPICRTGQYRNESIQLTPCSDGTFCCGEYNNDCCSNHEGSYAIQGVLVGPNQDATLSNTLNAFQDASTTTPTPAPAPTNLAVAGASSSPVPTTPASTGLGAGGIAAIVVGVIAAAALVMVAVVLFLMFRRRKAATYRRGSQDSRSMFTDGATLAGDRKVQYDEPQPYWASGSRHELPAEQMAHEKPVK